MELVPGQGQHVDGAVLEVDGQLAHRLHRVRVEHDPGGLGQHGHVLHREEGAGLVVGPHDRDDGDLVGQQIHVRLHVEPPAAVDLEIVDGVAVFLQMLAQTENRRMLDHGGDDLLAIRLGLQRREDRGRVRLGATGGEYDLRVVLRAEQGLHLPACLLDGPSHLVAELVQ